MKNLVAILFVGLISLGSFAQEKKVAKIEFKTDVIDYGTIEKGSDGVRTFEFTNTGNATLIISSVKSTCGCTVPKKPKGPIMPGETGEIEVKYDTKSLASTRRFTLVFASISFVILYFLIKKCDLNSIYGQIFLLLTK